MWIHFWLFVVHLHLLIVKVNCTKAFPLSSLVVVAAVAVVVVARLLSLFSFAPGQF